MKKTSQQKARAKKQGSKWITKARRRAIYERDNFTCAFCGQSVEDGVALTLDHLHPVELGGDNASSNLITACLSCNSAKGKKTNRSFFAYLRDKGIDTSKISSKISRQIRKPLNGNFRI